MAQTAHGKSASCRHFMENGGRYEISLWGSDSGVLLLPNTKPGKEEHGQEEVFSSFRTSLNSSILLRDNENYIHRISVPSDIRLFFALDSFCIGIVDRF